MTLYTKEEEEIWKCHKHSSKQQHNNIGICPYCLKERLSQLCPNCANSRPCSCSCTSSSSSVSSTFSLDLLDTRVSTLIESEPPRSIFPFFRSARFSNAECVSDERRKSLSIWSLFSKRDSTTDKITRSRSVSGKDRGKKWYFMNVFRYGKASKVDQDRSPINKV